LEEGLKAVEEREQSGVRLFMVQPTLEL